MSGAARLKVDLHLGLQEQVEFERLFGHGIPIDSLLAGENPKNYASPYATFETFWFSRPSVVLKLPKLAIMATTNSDKL